jgi:multiple sugar transport system substrate-binding protein
MKHLLTFVILALSLAYAQTEVTYMAWGSPEELTVWQTIADEFNAAHPDIKVNVDISDWEAYFNKLKTLFAGNTPPDVFAMDAPLYLDWQSRGVLLNLQPYIDKEAGMLDGFYPVTLQAYKLEDGYYGLPRDFQTIVLYYNKDMFDAAGVAYPTNDWTMEDLRTAAKALTVDKDGDGAPEQFGFSADMYDMELFWSGAIWGDGGDIVSEDHTQTLLADGTARDAWHMISEMMFEDGSIPDTDEATQYGYDVFAAGGSAMTTFGHWVVPEYAKLAFKWDVAAFPAGSAQRSTSVNSAGFVIAKDSKNPDAAWEFVKYATGPSGQTRLTELGFAIPVLQAVAESPVYLEQSSAPINHQVYLDALQYAHPKPVFRGYEEWSAVVGDGLAQVWTGDLTIDEALDEIVPTANDVLMNNQ